MGLEPDLDIVLAYGNFADGETVAARARQAIATLEARRGAIEQAIARL